jgi:hypothetical protein
MKQLINWIFFLTFIVFSNGLLAQSLTGIWRGTFFNPAEIAMGGSKYRYEVQIDNNGRDAKGVTYSYQTTRFYGKASLVGVWSTSSKNLVIQEDRMLDLKITGGGDGCLMTCYLTYKKEEGKEYLEGTYTSFNMNNKSQNCGGGKVFLEKVPDTDFELEDFLVKKNSGNNSKAKVKPGQEDYLVKKPATTSAAKPPATKPPSTAAKPPANGSTSKTTAKPPVTPNQKQVETKPKVPAEVQKEPNNNIVKAETEPVKPKKIEVPPPPVLKERKNELFKTILTSERFVEISFYDNGEIDGDTISIYNNNKLIASRKGISAKPVTLKIELSEDDAQQDIVMVAENLGAIPPNTALMIVQAGKDRYTLNLSSTEQKNAMVRFKYQPK